MKACFAASRSRDFFWWYWHCHCVSGLKVIFVFLSRSLISMVFSMDATTTISHHIFNRNHPISTILSPKDIHFQQAFQRYYLRYLVNHRSRSNEFRSLWIILGSRGSFQVKGNSTQLEPQAAEGYNPHHNILW